MKLSEELKWRGFVNQTTLADLTELDNKKWTFYHGFDASAPSQTIGNLAAMMLDRLFMKHGHNAVIVAGGATSLIGDPGGKDKERQLQNEDIVAKNVKAAEGQLKRVFKGYDFKLVNNLDWTRDLTVVEFLRDIGKHFSMTPLVQRDYIAKRLGDGAAGLSYAEFSYTILQGMDFLHLFDKYGVTLQFGGADQWGNCLSGVELIRKARGREAHVLTHPLVTNKTTGKKFGKTEEGAVWLDPEQTSPTQFYQFWINSDDVGVEEYIKIYTEMDKPEVDELINQHKQDPSKRLAQKRLAEEVTKLVHGEEETKQAKAVTEYLTGERKIGEATGSEAKEIRNEVGGINAQVGDSLADVLAGSGLASSKSDARRLISGKAISINGQKIDSDKIEESYFENDRMLIRKGKAFKDSALIERA